MVCRRWHSLIRRNPRFIERFNSHHHRHPPEYSLPWALIFRSNSCSKANTCHVYSDEWMFLHGKLPAKLFEFLPNSSNKQIRSSCNDLFLVGGKEDDLFVCKPITKQFVHLPSIPRSNHDQQRGLVVYSVAVRRVGFKVVQVRLFYLHLSSLELRRYVRVAVFCSVSRKWETRSFPCPEVDSELFGHHKLDNVVTVDDVLYWLGVSWNNRQILVYLDLEKEGGCKTIGIPPPGNKTCKHSIGALPVSGGSHELRLLQIKAYTSKKIVYLNVWRLNNNRNDDDSNWILVHDKRVLARPENLSETSCSFQGVFVHPKSGDFVLCVWGENVIEYNLVDSTYKELSMTDSRAIEKPPFLMVGASDSAAGLDL